jgi:hypothetical protein
MDGNLDSSIGDGFWRDVLRFLWILSRFFDVLLPIDTDSCCAQSGRSSMPAYHIVRAKIKRVYALFLHRRQRNLAVRIVVKGIWSLQNILNLETLLRMVLSSQRDSR